MDGDGPTNHGDDSPVFPETDYLSDEDDQELTAAETHYNNNGYGIKAVVATMAIGRKNLTNDGPLGFVVDGSNDGNNRDNNNSRNNHNNSDDRTSTTATTTTTNSTTAWQPQQQQQPQQQINSDDRNNSKNHNSRNKNNNDDRPTTALQVTEQSTGKNSRTLPSFCITVLIDLFVSAFL